MASRISSTVPSDRTYDIDFINWESLYKGEAQLSFGTVSKKTYGIVKAVNRFIKLFFTYKGSDPFDINSGAYTQDVLDMGGAGINDIGNFINTQISDIMSQLRELQNKNSFPSDENIISIKLSNVNYDANNNIVVKISIQTEAGSGTTIYVPITGG